MATTALSPLGVPGQGYSFLAKDPAAPGGPHTGLFTELSVLGAPGQRHSFSPKDPDTGAGPHTGDFTRLSVLAVPGGIHVFSAKTEAEAEPAPGGGQSSYAYPRKEYPNKEPDELFEIAQLSAILLSTRKIR